MLSDVHNYILKNDLIRPGDKVLLAVSGGIDSMVMAHIFLHLPYKTAIAHCNFSLRDKDSDLDEELVENFASLNNIPFHKKRFDTKSYSHEKGISVQMAARELRYSWFSALAQEHGYDHISVAHNLNDNAETMIINLVRGTGLAGLSGMKPSTGKIIRPLLFISREEITEYCISNRIAYREDRSNSEVKYTRNKIRHKVIPVLQQINPAVLNTFTESAERFLELNEIVLEYIDDLRKTISYGRNETIVCDIAKLKEHEKNKTVLFELFKPFGLNSMQVKDVINLLDGTSGSVILTPTHRILRDRSEIIITGTCKAAIPEMTITDIKEFPSFINAYYSNKPEDYRIPADPLIASLDFDKIMFPLIIRKWRGGDYFHPFGMNHKKKLSDYFIDLKYPLSEKEKKIVLESEGKIVWIIGDRIDNRFRITKETKRILSLSFNPSDCSLITD
ncbi:MAG TPA: tRNA lysidine(34) synthetase TilS [Bacteroidales bacterium]|nr:tRNA lysidine(34) synthetase TilS [Bacteroidales bacterium]